MNSTTGQAAELERARVRARDAIFDWARGNPQLRGLSFDVLLRHKQLPSALREGYMVAETERWA